MSTIRTLKTRPGFAAAAALGVVVLLLGIVPIPYQKTTAYDVALLVSGGHFDPTRVGEVAKELKAALGAEHVNVSALDERGSLKFTFGATVEGRAGAKADAVAQAFAKGLTARGYTASAVTTPRRERVWGPVVAYAVDRVISISVDGKSAAQLEQEIRQRLAEAGISDADVSVTDGPNGAQKIGIEVKREKNDSQPEVLMPDVQLTKDGVPLDAKPGATTLNVRKIKGPDGTALNLDVRNDGKTATVQIAHVESMSDAQLAEAVKVELRKAGLDLEVTVTNGRVMIQPPQH